MCPKRRIVTARTSRYRRFHVQPRPLVFHQSGGCCDGSSPMRFPDGEFIAGDSDILLGELDVPGLERPIPFWMSVSQSGHGC
jgi:uncharacterized protein